MQKPIQCLNGVMINDVARFFKGDSPAFQFEAGQASKREEISFVHLAPYIQTMLKTYDSQIKKK